MCFIYIKGLNGAKYFKYSDQRSKAQKDSHSKHGELRGE